MNKLLPNTDDLPPSFLVDDAHLQARLLVDVVIRADGADLASLPATPQDAGHEQWYFAMHHKIDKAVIDSLLQESA